MIAVLNKKVSKLKLIIEDCSEHANNNKKLFNRGNPETKSCITTLPIRPWPSLPCTRNGTPSLPIPGPDLGTILSHKNETRKRTTARKQIQRKVLPGSAARILNRRLRIRFICLCK